MTVRADITGRYSNRMYAYEPSDIKLCKSEITMFLFFKASHYPTNSIFYLFTDSVKQHAKSLEVLEDGVVNTKA